MKMSNVAVRAACLLVPFLVLRFLEASVACSACSRCWSLLDGKAEPVTWRMWSPMLISHGGDPLATDWEAGKGTMADNGTVHYSDEDMPRGIFIFVCSTPGLKDLYADVSAEIPVTKKLRRGRRQKSDAYDPGTSSVLLGHCFYACLWKMHYGNTPDKAKVMKLRRHIASLWRQHPEELKEQAEMEQLSPTEYLATFIFSGWGGIADLHLFDYVYAIDATVEDENGALLWQSRLRSARPRRWRLANEHFVLLNTLEEPRFTMRQQYGSWLSTALRGGMPRIQLRSRSRCRKEPVRLVPVSEEPLRQVPPCPSNSETCSPLVRLYKQQYCLMCQKWHTEAHKLTSRHITRLAEFEQLDPQEKMQKVAEWKQSQSDFLDPKAANIEREEWYRQEAGGRLCLLCGAWEDGQHRHSAKHIRRARQFLEVGDAERVQWLNEKVEALTPHESQPTRGGAGSSSDPAVDAAGPTPMAGANEQQARTSMDESDSGSLACEFGGVGGDATLGPPGPPSGNGDSGDHLTTTDNDGDHDYDPDDVTGRHDPQQVPVYCLNVCAAKMRTTLYVCPHIDLALIRSEIATIMRVTFSRICMLQEGAIVPFGGPISSWATMERMTWQVTSWPLSGQPSSLRIRTTAGVVLPARNLLCHACQRPEHKEDGASESDMDSDTLGDQLQSAYGQQQREQSSMEANDVDINHAIIHRPRESLEISFGKGMSVGELAIALARRKRIATTSHVMLQAVQLEKPVEDHEEFYFVPAKKTRGGAKEILVMGVWDAFPITVEDEETVHDLLARRSWLGLALWWGHLKLHSKAVLADIRGSPNITCYRR